MVENKKRLTYTIENIYNEQGEKFIDLLAQGVKRLDLSNIQKRLVIKHKEDIPNV
ncbi:MAG: hypothetical protein FWE04_03720 [Oscillospiraceae bacterium]|nr:hypothetical protein [Oscillospiraceae bacterium]